MVGADYVFTGEGSIDGQTLFGKTPFGVASIAKKYSIPVIAFAGRIGNGVESLYNNGFTSIVGILKGVSSLDEALESGEANFILRSRKYLPSVKIIKMNGLIRQAVEVIGSFFGRLKGEQMWMG